MINFGYNCFHSSKSVCKENQLAVAMTTVFTTLSSYSHGKYISLKIKLTHHEKIDFTARAYGDKQL